MEIFLDMCLDAIQTWVSKYSQASTLLPRTGYFLNTVKC